jgi:hypothetical protein
MVALSPLVVGLLLAGIQVWLLQTLYMGCTFVVAGDSVTIPNLYPKREERGLSLT